MTKVTRAAYVVATWGGLGYLRPAPGTWGSLGAVPLHWLLSQSPLGYHVASALLVAVLGILAAGRVAEHSRIKDPQFVVVDEVAGTLLAMLAVRDAAWWLQLLALLLFRVLDITKPGIIRRAERARPVGLGIMLDDLIAGVSAGLLAFALGKLLTAAS